MIGCKCEHRPYLPAGKDEALARRWRSRGKSALRHSRTRAASNPRKQQAARSGKRVCCAPGICNAGDMQSIHAGQVIRRCKNERAVSSGVNSIFVPGRCRCSIVIRKSMSRETRKKPRRCLGPSPVPTQNATVNWHCRDCCGRYWESPERCAARSKTRDVSNAIVCRVV